MRKIDFFYRTLIIFTLGVSAVFVSCNKDSIVDDDTIKDDVVIEDEAKEQSATNANFFSGNPRSLNVYDFKYNNTAFTKVEVENYNEEYTYQLKLTGKYFKKEYTVSLNKETKFVDGGGKEDVKNIKKNALKTTSEKESNVSFVDEVITTPKITLVADLENLELEADNYDAVLIEKDSKTTLTIVGYNSTTTHTIVDTDSPYYLCRIQIEDNNYHILSTLNLSQTNFRVRPQTPYYIKGIGIQLAVYDTALKLIGKVNYSGANSTTQGTYSYRFTSSNLNTIIPSNEEYLFRFEEREYENDSADKIYKKGIFQKIQVNKAGGLIIIKTK